MFFHILGLLTIARCVVGLAQKCPVQKCLSTPFQRTLGWWGALPSEDVVCELKTEDPTSWEASGAATLVALWLRENGEKDWLVNLERNLTSGEGNPNYLDCTKLGANTCTPPEKKCSEYNPPAHYFVRLAAARANDFFDQAYTSLLATAIDNILNLDSLISDFGPEVAMSWDKKFRIASASLSVAEKTLKQIPFIGSLGGDLIGLVAASTALIGLTTGPSILDGAKLKEDTQKQLHDIFIETEKNIDRMNSKILNGRGDLDLEVVMDILTTMRGAKFSEGDDHPIAKIMQGGHFLLPTDAATAQGGIREGMNTIKQGIIGALLKETGYFVYARTGVGPEDCGGENRYGSQLIDGKCYRILIQVDGGMQGADNRVYDKMQEYGINTVEFYKNVAECANGEIGEQKIGMGDGYQKCFFSLRTWEGEEPNACDAGGWKAFPELRLTDSICRPKKEPPCRRWCIRGSGWFGVEDVDDA